MTRPIRCLLIGPLSSTPNGFTGEDAYVKSLLEHPPEGVEYVFHDTLVAEEKARRVPWIHHLFYWLGERRLGILPHTWVQSLDTDESFDAIHIHGWSTYLAGGLMTRRTPVVISASSPPTYGLEAYLGWSDDRLRRYAAASRRLQRLLRVYDSYFFPGPARQIMVWSSWACDRYERDGIAKDKLNVVPPGLPSSQVSLRRASKHVQLLFIGNDFARKGGLLALEAYERLRGRFGSSVGLTVVSSQVTDTARQDGLTLLRQVPHSQMPTLYQAHDVFLLPSNAEGYGMSVIEAMSFGLPVVVSSAGALPEIARNGAGVVVTTGSVQSLYDALSTLVLRPELRRQMGDAARSRFLDSHEIGVTNAKLAATYQRAICDTGT